MAEQTYMIFHPTRLAFIKWYALAALLLIVGIAVFVATENISFLTFEHRLYMTAFLIAAGVILALLMEIKRHDDDYAITSERIVERTGLININQDSIYWKKLSNFSLKQGLFDRLFGIGTIELWSLGGEDKPQIVIKRAPNFKKIVEHLNKLAQKK